MHPEYLNILQRLRAFSQEVNRSLEETPAMLVDDNAAYVALCSLIDNISDTVKAIEHYAMPAFPGTLYERDDSKFELINDSGISIAHFSSNNLIEVYSEKFNHWFCGKIKRKYRHYYFFCNDLGDLPLHAGMVARVRTDL